MQNQEKQMTQILTQLQESKQDPCDKITDIVNQLQRLSDSRTNITSQMLDDYQKIYNQLKELERKYDELVQRNIHGWVC